MTKLGKEKGCEKIADWVKGARNHLYWCATSTKQGFEELIAAKWMSFMQHVANKHNNHEFSLFNKCAHDDQIENRRWIKIGTKGYGKLSSLLTNVCLVNDIKKLSADAQTSCLEGFHSTLNHWHPKLFCFSWLGTFCRLCPRNRGETFQHLKVRAYKCGRHSSTAQRFHLHSVHSLRTG